MFELIKSLTVFKQDDDVHIFYAWCNYKKVNFILSLLTFMLSWLKLYHKTFPTVHYISCYGRNKLQWTLIKKRLNLYAVSQKSSLQSLIFENHRKWSILFWHSVAKQTQNNKGKKQQRTILYQTKEISIQLNFLHLKSHNMELVDWRGGCSSGKNLTRPRKSQDVFLPQLHVILEERCNLSIRKIIFTAELSFKIIST